MRRMLAFLTVLFSTTRLAGQDKVSATIPVVAARISELGTIHDSTINGALIPDEAALSPRGNLIAYFTDHELRIWNVATHSSTILSSGWGESPVWSPAGDAIAFDREGDAGGQEYVYSLPLDPQTGTPRGKAQRVSLSVTTGNAPQFSPDGKSIAFPREDKNRMSSLVVVPSTGGPERTLVSGYGVRRLQWADDGSAIYYVSSPDSTRARFEFRRIPSAGGPSVLVHDFGTRSQPPFPGVAGRFVELPQDPTIDGNSTLVTDADGTPRFRFTYPNGACICDWSGKTRVVAIQAANPRSLRVVNLADGTSHVLLDASAEVRVATWFDDGRRVAAITTRGGPRLVTLNADGTGRRDIALAKLPQLARAPGGPFLHISPDGRYASYLGHGRKSIELVDLVRGTQRTLTSGSLLLTPFWTADSRSLRYIRFESTMPRPNQRAVHEISLDGTDRRLRDLSEYPQVTWGLDANTVVAFGHHGSILVPIEGATRVLVREPIQGGGLVSPDRKTIALRVGEVNRGRPAGKLTLVSLVDGSRRDIDLPFIDIGWMAFSADSRVVYMRGRETESGPLNVYSVPVEGGSPERRIGLGQISDPGEFWSSPDARLALANDATERRATFLLVDFAEMSKVSTRTHKP